MTDVIHGLGKLAAGPLRVAHGFTPHHEGSPLQVHSVEVAGHSAHYGEAGSGPIVVFLHGWGLDHRSYQEPLSHLVEAGFRVLTPALPGFGGTARLVQPHPAFTDYADWVADFLTAVGVDEPVLLMGHSFGGGVAIVFAHRHPDRIYELVVINAIGGAPAHEPGMNTRVIAARPLWDWGLTLSYDIWALAHAHKAVPIIFGEAIPNLARDPMAFWKVGGLARRADLMPELEDLRERGLPVVVLWGKRDALVSHESFDALCRALGRPSVVTVDGSHSWLLTDPKTFGDIIKHIPGVAKHLEGIPRHGRRRGDRSHAVPRTQAVKTSSRKPA